MISHENATQSSKVNPICTHGMTHIQVGTGHLDHLLSGSSGSHPLYKIFGSDIDYTIRVFQLFSD